MSLVETVAGFRFFESSRDEISSPVLAGQRRRARSFENVFKAGMLRRARLLEGKLCFISPPSLSLCFYSIEWKRDHGRVIRDTFEVHISTTMIRDRDFMHLYGIISNLRHVFTSKFKIKPYKCMKSRSLLMTIEVLNDRRSIWNDSALRSCK